MARKTELTISEILIMLGMALGVSLVTRIEKVQEYSRKWDIPVRALTAIAAVGAGLVYQAWQKKKLNERIIQLVEIAVVLGADELWSYFFGESVGDVDAQQLGAYAQKQAPNASLADVERIMQQNSNLLAEIGCCEITEEDLRQLEEIGSAMHDVVTASDMGELLTPKEQEALGVEPLEPTVSQALIPDLDLPLAEQELGQPLIPDLDAPLAKQELGQPLIPDLDDPLSSQLSEPLIPDVDAPLASDQLSEVDDDFNPGELSELAALEPME